MENDQIVKRLDVLVRLMLDEQLEAGKTTRKAQLLFLNSVGLSTGEIAKILGQPSKNISSYLKKAKDKKTGN